MARITRRGLLAAPLAMSPLACPAYAQAPWPSRPIRIVIPFGTGGGTDITTRLLAPKMAEILGQPVVLENRPGAGGMVGTDYVAKQPPNGEVFVLSTLSPIALARGLPAPWRGGRRAAVATQRELGMDGTGTRLADGSGVSRADRLTATGLARLVYLTRTDPRFTTMYAPAAMPRAGRTGTLASRYHRFSAPQTTCARGRVLAKTGTLHDTVSLAGVARGKRGTPADGHAYAFAVLVNNRVSSTSTLTVRKNVARIATTLTGCW